MSYPTPTSAAVTAVMRGNRKRDTRPEVAVRSELHRRGARFRKDFLVEVPGLRARPDVVFTRARVAVFLDGCYWHSCPTHGTTPRVNRNYWGPKLAGNVARDRRVDAQLGAAGWKVVRIWEHVPPDDAARIVVGALREINSLRRPIEGGSKT